MTHVETLGISNIINFHCTGGGTSLEQAETLGSCDFLESFVRSFEDRTICEAAHRELPDHKQFFAEGIYATMSLSLVFVLSI